LLAYFTSLKPRPQGSCGIGVQKGKQNEEQGTEGEIGRVKTKQEIGEIWVKTRKIKRIERE